jgi:large subunit ribosomal protein L10
MMSKRPEKIAIIEEVRTRLDEAGFVILADCQGMDVETMGELRGRLLSQSSTLLVAKNTYLGKASEDIGWTEAEQFLAGPTALITGTGDVSVVAKTLQKFAKETSKPSVKGGRLGETTLSADDVKDIADIPSREVLYAMVAGTLAAPMTQLVGVFQQKVSSLLYVLKAVEEKKSNA